MSPRLNPEEVKQQISNLLLHYPELQEDEQFRADMIEAETGAHEFLGLIVKSIGENKAQTEGIKLYCDELRQRSDRIANRIEALRALAFGIMQRADLSKVELDIATLSIRKGQQKLMGDVDPAALPESLVKITRAADRTKIKEAIQGGAVVPGFELSNAEPSLAIRVK